MTTKPDRTIIVEPATTRTLSDWSPALIKAARAMADSGNLELAADFCESAMGDDRVQAALSTRTKGLVALPLSFEEVRGAKRLVKALDPGEDWWSAFPATALAQLLSWGILLGVGLGRIVWTDRGETINRIVPTLKVWHPRHLRYDWRRRMWTVKVEGGKTEDVIPGEGSWILYTPYGDSRPWAFGAWRAIALWQLLKQYAIEDWGYYSEKNAGGLDVAESSSEVHLTKEARKELAADLFAMKANSALVMPAGLTFKKVESTANTWQTFQAQKDAADMGMSVALLGQNLSTEVSGPVSTGATLHGRVLQVFIDADAETLSTCIHDQALIWWAEFNFGNRNLAPWPLWDTKPPEDQKQRADVLNVLASAINTLQNANAPIDVRGLLEKYGVPLQDPKDVEQTGQVFKYHLDYGALTLNEIRERLGLPPIKGGDEAPKPVAAPAAPTGNKPAKPDDDTEEDEKKALVSLRSGLTVRDDSGLVQGQAYADAVANTARDRATKILDDDLVAILEAVDAGESLEDIRARLIKTYKGMSSDALAKLMTAALTMAELGGRHAINEDL
jgi:phage gp29-like protein